MTTATPNPPSTDDATPAPNTLTIDELSATTRVASRTIRFYQAKGLLPRPELRGRVAYYGPAHLDRLKLVAELQDRGLQIKAIGDLLERVDDGELALHEWLGLEHELKEPWANDKPRILEAAELAELAGKARPGRVSDLVRVGLVERRGETFFVPSPATLQLGLRFEAVGIDLDSFAEVERILRKRLAKTAGELAENLLSRTRAPRRGGRPIADVMRDARPIALDAVRLIFAQEMEQQLHDLVVSGQTTKIVRR